MCFFASFSCLISNMVIKCLSDETSLIEFMRSFFDNNTKNIISIYLSILQTKIFTEIFFKTYD